ncbi:hypothetical protein Tco_1372764 [Tanacetum coccineum]
MLLVTTQSIDKAKLLFVMGTVVIVYVFVHSLTDKTTVVTDHVRGRNPHARFLTAVPIMVSVALLLVNIGAAFGIGLGAFLVWSTRRHEDGYPGRLLWYGFVLNIVAFALTLLGYVLILYSWFTS